MKTKLLIILASIFVCFSAKGQKIKHTYLDAVKLAEMYVAQKKNSDFTAILNGYGIQSDHSNPIIKSHEIDIDLRHYVSNESVTGGDNENYDYNKFLIEDKQQGNNSLDVSNLQTSELSGLSWQSAVLNGTATFMAERFKAEMANTVLQTMFKKIQNEDYENIEILFPGTLKQLTEYYPSDRINTYYSSDLDFFRQLIIYDINNLPKSIAQSETLRIKMDPKSSDLMVIGYHLMNYTKQEYPIPHLIEKISKEKYFDSSIKEITEICYLFSEALRDSDKSNTAWVNPALNLKYNPKKSDDVKDLTATFFYALLYEQLKDYSRLSENISTDPLIFTKSIENLLSAFNSFNSAYELVKENKLKKGDIDDYLNYTDQILSTYKDVFGIDIIKKSYSIDQKYIEYIHKTVRIYKPILKQEYEKVLPIVLVEIGTYLPDSLKIQNMRSINFLSQLAAAKTGKDIESVLDSFALPIGSASIKRASYFNISLNGYVGLTAGRETAYSDYGNQTKWNLGLAAPIGISATHNNFTLFASIIDLGTMVNVRLGGDNGTYTGIKFEHFLSPGLGLYWNVPEAPVTFGFHYSYVPNLRTIKFEDDFSTTVTSSDASVGRINFSVLVDIPLLTIYNKGN